MTTKIFKSYEEFLYREDEKVNGVSPEFANANPDFESDNKTNEGCWNCFGSKHCRYSKKCYLSKKLYECSDCVSCDNCDNVHGAVGISNTEDLEWEF